MSWVTSTKGLIMIQRLPWSKTNYYGRILSVTEKRLWMLFSNRLSSVLNLQISQIWWCNIEEEIDLLNIDCVANIKRLNVRGGGVAVYHNKHYRSSHDYKLATNRFTDCEWISYWWNMCFLVHYGVRKTFLIVITHNFPNQKIAEIIKLII